MKEAIIKRESVRNFIKQPLTTDDTKFINEYIANEENQKGLFNDIKLNIIEMNIDGSNKIGTYGFVKNFSGIIFATIPNRQDYLIDYGFVLEKLVLELTRIGIGTCWLGGTFERKSLVSKYAEEGDIIPAIIVLGYQKNSRHLQERIIRMVAKPKKRLDVSKFTTVKNLNTFEDYSEEIEMLRLAPSASNKQPWRITVDDSIYFDIETKKNYEMFSKIDLGIGVSHFYLTAVENGKNINIVKDDNHILKIISVD